MKKTLTKKLLCQEAKIFANIENNHKEKTIFGVTDGKAIGTYLEHKFKNYLATKYDFESGNSAKGIDFPKLFVDMKVTSIKQPQSSCPFKSARQKIFGLGYSLLIFVYEKFDETESKTGKLKILHTIFVSKEQTADFQTTSGILEILKNEPNADDIVAFLSDRMLPVDDIQAFQIAEEILVKPPELGFLTISNALQWRLQYGRVIQKAGEVKGVKKLV